MGKTIKITHDEARELVFYKNPTERRRLEEYISQQEKIAKDTKRYFELQGMFVLLTKPELNEYYKLQEKLSKVGI